MQVLPQCGHAVHEDAPEKVRDSVYINRHKETLDRKWNFPSGKDDFICHLQGCFCDAWLICSFLFLQVADALATFMVRHKFTDFKEGFLW